MRSKSPISMAAAVLLGLRPRDGLSAAAEGRIEGSDNDFKAALYEIERPDTRNFDS